jgi:heme-degrading monooxygenase HmoA
MPSLPWRTKLPAIAHQDYLVMASRLPLRSHRSIPRFLGLTASVARQLEGTSGLVGYRLLAQPMRKTFWTLSAWTDRDALDAFVRTMPHLAVMERLRTHMGPTRFTTWMTPGSALPIAWDDAIERLPGVSAAESPASP